MLLIKEDDLVVRLYCNPSESYLRRSTQTVFYLILKCLNERLAPIMPYLAQELYNELSIIGLRRIFFDKIFVFVFVRK